MDFVSFPHSGNSPQNKCDNQIRIFNLARHFRNVVENWTDFFFAIKDGRLSVSSEDFKDGNIILHCKKYIYSWHWQEKSGKKHPIYKKLKSTSSLN